MPRILPGVALVLLVIYCIVEVAQAEPLRVRLLPRWLWAAFIILLPGLGSIAWLIFGRPLRTRPSPAPRPPSRPQAPDDDPDFLKGL